MYFNILGSDHFDIGGAAEATKLGELSPWAQ